MKGVALVELLNSFDSGSAELATDAYFIVMVKLKTRQAATPPFYRYAYLFHRFNIVCQDKVNFHNLLTLS